jgi:DNA-binding transcriptional regulator YiaG
MKNQHWSRKGDKIKQPYRYMGCGLDNIYLRSGFEIIKDADGEGVIIHGIDELHAAIALYLVREQKVLSGKEIRYLRTHMDLSQSGLGKLLGCDSQTIARYEKAESAIPTPTDRLLRTILVEHVLGNVNVHDVIKNIEDLEGRSPKRYEFVPSGKGWKSA